MGTTSFRTTEMNRRIEQQLQYLAEFWKNNPNEEWNCNNRLQSLYYQHLKNRGFVDGEARMPDKDAREKTSGLVELGLIDESRKITEAGNIILNISLSGDFSSDGNILDLPRDSYQYFMQLIKGTKTVGDEVIRPFLVFLFLINSITPDKNGKKYLTQEEFTYLLPLCSNLESTNQIIDRINSARMNSCSVDVNSAIISHLLQMDNYQEALGELLSANEITEDVICNIGLNRKSRNYDKIYYKIYNILHSLTFQGINRESIRHFEEAIKKSNISKHWYGYFAELFECQRKSKGAIVNCNLSILTAKKETIFREWFFRILHLLKARATLGDYADLNRRYFKLSDCILFQDNIVQLDIMPQALVQCLKDWIKAESFKSCDYLTKALPLENIVQGLKLPSKEQLVALATGGSYADLCKLGGIKEILKKERYKHFGRLLNDAFSPSQVAHLIEMLEERNNDKDIQALVSTNADVPTIFEYLVALAWYYISDCKGDVLDYMNLSLDADCRPKTHAGGGMADIVWQYGEALPYYHTHTLLLEATLAEKDSQRRLEMEPVSRHLGDYILEHTRNTFTYCTFITTSLNMNVISDFRNRKTYRYYNKEATESIRGMKIIPIDTQMLAAILRKGLKYNRLYSLFDEYYNRNDEPKKWYESFRFALLN